MKHPVVKPQEWLKLRRQLLEQEKEFTKRRDELNALRRKLPWVKVEKSYTFDTPDGPKSLPDLFGACSQLIVYHFMFGPDWEEGCKSCSFWADNFDNAVVHLRQRDVQLVAISRGPLERLLSFKTRMNWSFPWVSSAGNDFNYDFNVSFGKDQQEKYYNYQQTNSKAEELPGMSVFYKDENGQVFHTYSAYARGLDMLNGTYHFLDTVPKGRDESALPYAQSWVKHKDRY